LSAADKLCWPFSVIGAWSILLRPPTTVTSFFKLASRGLLGILCGMEKQDHQKPTSQRCSKGGEQPKFITNMLDPPTGRTFQMFDCQCGNRIWISEKAAAWAAACVAHILLYLIFYRMSRRSS
jgi:hypothetical protein